MCDRLIDKLGTLRLDQLTVPVLRAWWAQQRAKVAPATCNRRLVRLKNILAEAVEAELIPKNPAKVIRKLVAPKPYSRPVTPKEWELLVQHANRRLLPYILTAHYTAQRRGSLLKIRRRDIDLDSMRIYFPLVKSQDSHEMPLHPRLYEALLPLPNDPNAPVLYPYRDGSAVSRAFCRLCRRLGIRGLKFHGLKHDALTKLAEKGNDVFMLQAISGNKDLRSLQRYVHLGGTEAVRQALNGL